MANKALEEFINENYTTGSYGGVEHGCGLPAGVLVRPEWSPIDGGHVIVVTNTTVQSFVCRYPWGRNDWRTRSACHEYSSPDRLKELLDGMIREPQGCWS